LAASGVELGYRGERLGLPESGLGSAAGYGARIGAIFIDWIACAIIAKLIFPQFAYGSRGSAIATLILFFLVKSLFTVFGGSSFGQRLLGVRVAAFGKTYVPAWRAFLRTFLICLVIPAVIWDRDGRGLHDRAANTVVLRNR
jgi:uncharacterized RDD family membrane protein YckC